MKEITLNIDSRTVTVAPGAKMPELKVCAVRIEKVKVASYVCRKI